MTADAQGERSIGYDKLVIGTGAVSVRPPIHGLTGPHLDGVHLLHSMGDTFELMQALEQRAPKTALIVGAGYIGVEMAEALCARGLQVTQMEQLAQVLPTVDPEFGSLVHAELTDHGVDVLTHTTVRAIHAGEPGAPARWKVEAVGAGGVTRTREFDMVLVGVGVRPDTELAAEEKPERRSAPRVRSPSTDTCAPTSPTFTPPATASSPTTNSSASPTCHWGRRRTNRAESRAKNAPRRYPRVRR